MLLSTHYSVYGTAILLLPNAHIVITIQKTLLQSLFGRRPLYPKILKRITKAYLNESKVKIKSIVLIKLLNNDFISKPGSWSSGNVFFSGAGGLRIKSRAGQIGHIVANGSPPLQHFFRKKLCCPGAMTRRWAPQTRYTLRRNTTSIIKDSISFYSNLNLQN